jgi:hypothetical protein
MTKCDGCVYKRNIRKYKKDDYINSCKLDWGNVGMTRKHCPCKECILKVNCSSYCDKLSDFYYDIRCSYVTAKRKL